MTSYTEMTPIKTFTDFSHFFFLLHLESCCSPTSCVPKPHSNFLIVRQFWRQLQQTSIYGMWSYCVCDLFKTISGSSPGKFERVLFLLVWLSFRLLMALFCILFLKHYCGLADTVTGQFSGLNTTVAHSLCSHIVMKMCAS